MTVTPPRDLPSVRLEADSPLQVVYAWERWGNFINARPGDDIEIPYDAARLEVKTYAHPLGDVRVLRFPKTRTHNHVNKTDTILYEWTARRVQFVGDDAAVCGPGHVALHPKGVFHHGETLTPGMAVEFAMEVGEPVPNPLPVFVPPEEAPWVDAAWWNDAGSITDVDVANAGPLPEGARRYARRTIALGAYTVREVRLAAGAVLHTSMAGRGSLLVVLAGAVTLPGGQVLGVEDNACHDGETGAEYQAQSDVTLVEAILP